MPYPKTRRSHRKSSPPDSASTVPIANAALACNEGKELPPWRQSLTRVVSFGRSRPVANFNPSVVTKLNAPASSIVYASTWPAESPIKLANAQVPATTAAAVIASRTLFLSWPLRIARSPTAKCFRISPSYAWAAPIAVSAPPKYNQSLASQRTGAVKYSFASSNTSLAVNSSARHVSVAARLAMPLETTRKIIDLRIDVPKGNSLLGVSEGRPRPKPIDSKQRCQNHHSRKRRFRVPHKAGGVGKVRCAGMACDTGGITVPVKAASPVAGRSSYGSWQIGKLF